MTTPDVEDEWYDALDTSYARQNSNPTHLEEMTTSEVEEAESRWYGAEALSVEEAESRWYEALSFEEAESRWLQALRGKDCVRLMRILKVHPTLLMMGWNAVLCKGCTALHVAAEQGCVDLIVQLLLLFPFLDLDVLRSYHSEDKERQFQALVAFEHGESTNAASEETERNGQNVARDDMAHSEQETSFGGQSTNAASEETERNGQNVARDDTARSEQEISSDGEHPSSSVDTLSGVSFSKEDLGRLLLARDGEHKVVALAMAAVHCNVDAIILLIYAYGNIADPPFGIPSSSELEPLVLDRESDMESIFQFKLPTLVLDPILKDMKNRLQLRLLTKNFIEREVAFSAYKNEADFNFLPCEEYCLHFLVTRCSKDYGRELCVRFWNELMSIGGSIWRFLLKLRDGKGRTPFQVAMEDKFGLTVDGFLRAVLKIEGDDESEVVRKRREDYNREVLICAMTATDGAGRTPAHRAAVTGAHEALRVLLQYSVEYKEVSHTFRATWEHPCASDMIRTRTAHSAGETTLDLSNRSGRWRNLSCCNIIPSSFRRLSLESGFGLEVHRLQPLHAAIAHRNYDAAKLIMEKASVLRLDTSYCIDEEIDKDVLNQVMSAPVYKYDILAFTYYAGIDIALARRSRDDVSPKEFLEFLVKPIDRATFRRSVGATFQNCFGRKIGDEDTNLHEGQETELKVKSRTALRIIASSTATFRHSFGAAFRHYFGRNKGAKATDLHEFQETDLEVVSRKALHMVASSADYKMLYWLLYPPKCDPTEEDSEGNNALHYTMQVREFSKLKLHLLHHVALPRKEIEVNPPAENESLLHKRMIDEGLLRKRMIERQGCVDLLLQVGCDLFKENRHREAPYPQGSSGENPEFLSYWVGKQLKHFKTTQSSYSSITTAISVTATLIATGSYVGPLTPPLGFGTDQNIGELQYQNRWVAAFIFCDTLSFYLAIIALILSLVASLPVPTQSMKSELNRTWTTIVLAMVALLPSIASVLVAFASSSMAGVTANLTSSIGIKLTIAPLSGCVPFIIAAFFLLLVRLLMSLFPRNKLVKTLYKSTDIVFG